MRIRRSKPTNNYVLIPNGTARDERLSYLARGVLVEILSRPDGWETNADALSERARQYRGGKRGEGRRALREAFAELEAAGYMIRHKERGPKGRIVTLMEAYDTPQNRGTANGMSAPTCDDVQTPSSDRGTANGISETNRDTANGTSVATSENTQTPRSDRRTANRPSVSGTSIRKTEDKDGEEEKQAGRRPARRALPAVLEPLRTAIAAAGLGTVSWDIRPDDADRISCQLDRLGADLMVESAVDGARCLGRPASVTAWIGRWESLPDPQPITNLPAAAGAEGNVLPLRVSRQQQETDDLFDRAMARAIARDAAQGGTP